MRWSECSSTKSLPCFTVRPVDLGHSRLIASSLSWQASNDRLAHMLVRNAVTAAVWRLSLWHMTSDRPSDVTPYDVNCHCCGCRICAREDRSLLTAAFIYFPKLIRRKDIYGLCGNLCSQYENGHQQRELLILTTVQKKKQKWQVLSYRG